MDETFQFLIRHDVAFVFAVAFVDQIGLPLPAAPWLLAAGALAVTGEMNWLTALGAAILGGLLADLIWFYLGRHYGKRVLDRLCRVSRNTDSCMSL